MTGKPITTDVNPAPAEKAGEAGILADLRASGDSGPALGDLGPLSARPKRRVSVQTLVLALVLVLSAAALYTMRTRSINDGMRFRTKSPAMSSEIEKVKSQSTQAEQRILADLAKSSLPAQAESEPLQKNPFVLDTPAGETPAAPARDTNAERLAALREKLGNIRLNSVMEGPHPIARINDRLVSVGDMVDEVFLVAQIHDRSVDLIAEGRTYTLSMGEAAGNSPTRRPARGPQLPMQPPAPTPRH